jgi:hypothetical protein
MNTLKDLGFVLEHETPKALCWSCPLGSFWLPRQNLPGQPPFPYARLENLEAIAGRTAAAINTSWVPVNVLERTTGGAARVSFSAKRMRDETREDDGPTEKRATLHLPAGWLIQRDGQWYAPASKLAEKLDDHHSWAEARRRRAYAGWRPVPGQLTTADEVLTWLHTANAGALREEEEKRQRAAQARLRDQLERYNKAIDSEFNMVLEQQYIEAAKAFYRTARGRAAELPDPKRYWGHVLVRACLKHDDFLAYAAKRAARAAAAEVNCQ